MIALEIDHFPSSYGTSSLRYSCGCEIDILKISSCPVSYCSSDLASSDNCLFFNITTWLAVNRFHSNEKVIVETYAYFARIHQSYYFDRINVLEQVIFKKLKSFLFLHKLLQLHKVFCRTNEIYTMIIGN